MRGPATALAAAGCSAAVLACGGGDAGPQPDRALSGGDTTVFDTSREAFSLPLRNLPARERRRFVVGNSIFNRNWVTAPSSTTGTDGLGPTFNAQSCSACHFKDGRARPPAPGAPAADPEVGLLLRLSVPGGPGPPRPDRVYGGQLQDRAIEGVPAEAILWHGGEAEAAKERFRALPARERADLLAFLNSL